MRKPSTIPAEFLIVDDDVSNNFLCECAINVLFPKSNVRSFTNPELALIAIDDLSLKELEPESIVIFLDINMPLLSGWNFLDRFENLDVRVQEQFTIYMLTSSIDPHDKTKASLRQAVAGFLSKPLIVSELRELFSY